MKSELKKKEGERVPERERQEVGLALDRLSLSLSLPPPSRLHRSSRPPSPPTTAI